jgi:hypothetical protein
MNINTTTTAGKLVERKPIDLIRYRKTQLCCTDSIVEIKAQRLLKVSIHKHVENSELDIVWHWV